MSSQKQTVSLWFLNNPTAANLLMLVFVFGGVLAMNSMRQEVFPTMVRDTLLVEVEFRGATAGEVEEQIVRPIEQSLGSLRDVQTVVSEAVSGKAEIFVMLEDGANVQRSLDEARAAVDGIVGLPTDSDPPSVVQLRDTNDVIEMGLYGASSQSALHRYSSQVRDRLLALPEVGQVEISGAGEPELSVLVSPEQARLFGLSLTDIANSIGEASFNISGGALRSSTGEYGLRMGANRLYPFEYSDISILETGSGDALRLKEIATIEERFRPGGSRFQINGSMGVLMSIFAAGSATPSEVSQSVRQLLADLEEEYPIDVHTVIFDDDAQNYSDRVGVLMESALLGLVLVLGLLFLTLDGRVAFWVAAGLPIAMLGGVALFALTPFTINFISIFAFIIVIGVVVDDAVVIGESIYSGTQDGLTANQAATRTIVRYGPAIVLAIATNIIAFLPILALPGRLGLFLSAIPVVTTCVFIISLIEALWILPAHLAHGRQWSYQLDNGYSQRAFNAFRDTKFIPWVARCLRSRAMVLTFGLGISAIVIAWVVSGRVSISLQPSIVNHEIEATFALSPGTPQQQLNDTAQSIKKAGEQILSELGSDDDLAATRLALGFPANHQGSVTFTLVPPEDRSFTAGEFTSKWREAIGQPANLTQLSMDYLSGPGGGRDLTIELTHASHAESQRAAEVLATRLRTIPGVMQVSYSGTSFRPELKFDLTPTGRALGFDELTIASRVRAHLDGLEAARFTRGKDELRVMVRGERQQADDLTEIKHIVITSNVGRQAPLSEIARIRWERGPVHLRRINNQLIERVEASINSRTNNGSLVEDILEGELLPQLELDFPGLTTWPAAIDTDEDQETTSSLMNATVGVLVTIFCIIASFSRSASSALVIMASIPLSAVGALFGHIIMGEELGAASFMGVLALSGLVINTALLLHLRYRDALNSSAPPTQAMLTAVQERFRPIVLSSVTTLLGLLPLIISSSVHASVMQPLAISIGFGMLFSIPVVMVLLPCLIVEVDSRVGSSRIQHPSQRLEWETE